ncbi:MAG TPA: flagellar FlbD family protein [Acidimicrobiales bacterium]|nr:flagellar FlbD family protein [Acidimicrobiales bacterium]
MIAVKKLDGTTMHLNEDLIERVADGAEGQAAIYFRDGAHIVVANDAVDVVDFIRTEKVEHLLRVLGDSPSPSPTAITKLSGIRNP